MDRMKDGNMEQMMWLGNTIEGISKEKYEVERKIVLVRMLKQLEEDSEQQNITLRDDNLLEFLEKLDDFVDLSKLCEYIEGENYKEHKKKLNDYLTKYCGMLNIKFQDLVESKNYLALKPILTSIKKFSSEKLQTWENELFEGIEDIKKTSFRIPEFSLTEKCMIAWAEILGILKLTIRSIEKKESDNWLVQVYQEDLNDGQNKFTNFLTMNRICPFIRNILRNCQSTHNEEKYLQYLEIFHDEIKDMTTIQDKNWFNVRKMAQHELDRFMENYFMTELAYFKNVISKNLNCHKEKLEVLKETFVDGSVGPHQQKDRTEGITHEYNMYLIEENEDDDNSDPPVNVDPPPSFKQKNDEMDDFSFQKNPDQQSVTVQADTLDNAEDFIGVKKNKKKSKLKNPFKKQFGGKSPKKDKIKDEENTKATNDALVSTNSQKKEQLKEVSETQTPSNANKKHSVLSKIQSVQDKRKSVQNRRTSFILSQNNEIDIMNNNSSKQAFSDIVTKQKKEKIDSAKKITLKVSGVLQKLKKRGLQMNMFKQFENITVDETKSDKIKEGIKFKLSEMSQILNIKAMANIFSECEKCLKRCSKLSPSHMRGVNVTELLSEFLPEFGEYELEILDILIQAIPPSNFNIAVDPMICDILNAFYVLNETIETIYYTNLYGKGIEYDASNNIDQLKNEITVNVNTEMDVIITGVIENILSSMSIIFKENIACFQDDSLESYSTCCKKISDLLWPYVENVLKFQNKNAKNEILKRIGESYFEKLCEQYCTINYNSIEATLIIEIDSSRYREIATIINNSYVNAKYNQFKALLRIIKEKSEFVEELITSEVIFQVTDKNLIRKYRECNEQIAKVIYGHK